MFRWDQSQEGVRRISTCSVTWGLQSPQPYCETQFCESYILTTGIEVILASKLRLSGSSAGVWEYQVTRDKTK